MSAASDSAPPSTAVTAATAASMSTERVPLTNASLRTAVLAYLENPDDAVAQYGPIRAWNTAAVTNMMGLFQNARAFNDNISTWDTAHVTDMSHMFHGAAAFNQPLNSWNTSRVTGMSHMFHGAAAFNQPLNSWNTSRVTSMSHMFHDAAAFNQPLNSWNTSRVTSMSHMFHDAAAFDGPVHRWNTSRVRDMSFMLCNAVEFRHRVDCWDTSLVGDFRCMFLNADKFNGNYPFVGRDPAEASILEVVPEVPADSEDSPQVAARAEALMVTCSACQVVNYMLPTCVCIKGTGLKCRLCQQPSDQLVVFETCMHMNTCRTCAVANGTRAAEGAGAWQQQQSMDDSVSSTDSQPASESDSVDENADLNQPFEAW